jgi:hypothetical protein
MNPNFFFGGGFTGPPGFFPPNWLPNFTGDAEEDDDVPVNERAFRINSFLPFIPDISQGRIPRGFKPEHLEHMIKDFKDEGNERFRAKHYVPAEKMYEMALGICRALHTFHDVHVEKDLLSTLFSNHAACLLKMDMFKESIEDCENAIQLNRDNIKAYYRKAVAQKMLREYQSSLNSAEAGRDRSLQLNRVKEAKDFMS